MTDYSLVSKKDLYKCNNEKEILECLCFYGISLVRENKKEKWINFVSEMYPENLKIPLVILSYMEKVDKGMPYFEAESAVYGEEFDLNKDEIRECDKLIVSFINNRRDFISYLKYVFDEGNGIIKK